MLKIDALLKQNRGDEKLFEPQKRNNRIHELNEEKKK